MMSVIKQEEKMNPPTDQTAPDAEQPVESPRPDQPITPTDDTKVKPPAGRKPSKFSNLVTLVAPAKNSNSQLRPSQTSNRPTPTNLLSGISRKRPDPKSAAAAQIPKEVEDIGRFVFFHGREKRYLDGLRRRTIPLQTFALSLSLGVAIGCAVAIVSSLAFRVFWNFQESSVVV